VQLRWAEIEREQVEFVNRVANESLRRMLPVRETQISLAHLMQHLANHSTYHRGQISLMMRQVAAAPVATDFALFLLRDAARQPMHASLLNEDLIQPGKLEMGISHRTGGRTRHFDWAGTRQLRMVGKPYLMALRQSCP